eukprot:CAMPEP_0114379322 /NCGR_PEP_ID=MMETSP0102-20121206/2164_1 /TAXON_ID=38822 ORGANISM="Pteridomonas danica, Strain PT" /NCGR_SAMPLE_ID=MMETSP0102 /ASSEMBLY_ACC=CAM_ASM_000212 /LENGTH=86 /DNA_ID=CAMNT_0001534349 /DNA_START=830 /DNA_END=1087 /DNA_ORIENTATION=+
MISLFQVATLASWSSVAYTSWYGCGNYHGDPYYTALSNNGGEDDDEIPSRVITMVGIVQGFKCRQVLAKPELVFLVFTLFGIISAW